MQLVLHPTPDHVDPAPALPPDAFDRAVTHLASSRTLSDSNFFRRLRSGRSVSLGVLGASVAQQGGCLEQPGHRCMKTSRRGYFVRLLLTINATWPHPAHQIFNGAVDATPAHMFLSCLLPLLPPSPHLILLEFGSMARFLRFRETEELVRRLLRLPSRPLLLFVTVREWCATAHLRHKHSNESDDNGHRVVKPDARTAHSIAEAVFTRICEHYERVSCLSHWAALSPLFYARAPHFSMSDIAADCLHPHLGRHGDAYLTALLEHWLQRAFDSASSVPMSLPPSASARLPASQHQLPAPLYERPPSGRSAVITSTMSHADRCWILSDPGASGAHFRYARMQMLPWRTASCGDVRMPFKRCEAEPLARCPYGSWRWPQLEGGGRAQMRANPTAMPPESQIGALPRVWFVCLYALVPIIEPNLRDGGIAFRQGKRSEGAVALVPGATIELPIDVRWAGSDEVKSLQDLRRGDRRASNSTWQGARHGLRAVVQLDSSYRGMVMSTAPSAAPSAAPSLACAQFSYLTSHVGMGIAAMRCQRGCTCEPRTLNAHRVAVDGERNVSIFKQQLLTLNIGEEVDEEGATVAAALCWLRVSVLSESSSGAHKFKISTVSVTLGGACENEQSY